MKRFTAMRLSPAAHAAALALLIVATALNASPATAAGEAESIQFAVNARVVDATGWPIENVRVSIAGSSSASEVTGTNGRALLRVPIGTPAEIAAHTVELTVEAGEKKPAYALTDGSAALRIEIASTGQTLAVRSSSAAMTTAVARMLRTSEGRSIAIELLFLATPPSGVKRVAALGPAEEVLLTGSQATAAPVNPAPPPVAAQQRASAPAESTHAARVEPSRAKPDRHATVARPPAKSANVAATLPPPAANTARSQGAATSPSPTPKPQPPPSATSESPPAKPAPQPSLVGTSSQTTRTVPHVISTPSEEVPVLSASRPQRENEKECRCRLTGSV
ncbi:MAG TPA: hypothetical protein VL123_02445, partial [Candidatus Udaeobacter sp.]|nr:hypothetical protein [Candidatus Udaeobacter sp.]